MVLSSTRARRSWSHGGDHARRDRQRHVVAGHGAVRRDHGVAGLRKLGAPHQSQADHRLHPPGGALVPRLCVRDRDRGGHFVGSLPVVSGLRQDIAGASAGMKFSPEAIISLIATAFALVAFLLMLQESIALRQGTDPISNGVRAFVRRYPRVTYALAVVIGMLLGHLLWP